MYINAKNVRNADAENVQNGSKMRCVLKNVQNGSKMLMRVECKMFRNADACWRMYRMVRKCLCVLKNVHGSKILMRVEKCTEWFRNADACWKCTAWFGNVQMVPYEKMYRIVQKCYACWKMYRHWFKNAEMLMRVEK